MKAIYILRDWFKGLEKKKVNHYIIFISLEKACDRIPRVGIWQVLEKKHVYK